MSLREVELWKLRHERCEINNCNDDSSEASVIISVINQENRVELNELYLRFISLTFNGVLVTLQGHYNLIQITE